MHLEYHTDLYKARLEMVHEFKNKLRFAEDNLQKTVIALRVAFIDTELKKLPFLKLGAKMKLGFEGMEQKEYLLEEVVFVPNEPCREPLDGEIRLRWHEVSGTGRRLPRPLVEVALKQFEGKN
jgi:hypothetical protein